MAGITAPAVLHEMANSYAKVAAAIAAGNVDSVDQTAPQLIDYVEKFTLKVIDYSTGHDPAS